MFNQALLAIFYYITKLSWKYDGRLSNLRSFLKYQIDAHSRISIFLCSAGISFEVCIVDDASLCSEAELLPLFRLKLNTLLLVGDEKLQTSTTQNEVSYMNRIMLKSNKKYLIFAVLS